MTGFFEGVGEGLEPIPHTLGFHSDVVISNPVVADFLRFDGTYWVNQQAVISNILLSELGDVDLTIVPTDAQVLTFSIAQGKWIAASPTGSGGGFDNLYELLDIILPPPASPAPLNDFLVSNGVGQWTNKTLTDLTLTSLTADTITSTGVANLDTVNSNSSAANIVTVGLQQKVQHNSDFPTYGTMNIGYANYPSAGNTECYAISPSSTTGNRGYLFTTYNAGVAKSFGMWGNLMHLPNQTGAGATVPVGEVAITKAYADAEYGATGFVATTTQVIAGTGLTGGGALTGNITLNVGSGDGITVNANNITVDSTVVRTSGNQTINGLKLFNADIEGINNIIARGALASQLLSTPGPVYSASFGTLTNVNPSDKRLKKDITKITGSLERIMKLNPVSFKWIEGEYAGHGFLAQEAGRVFPELATVDSEGIEVTFNYLDLIAYLVDAVQELNRKI